MAKAKKPSRTPVTLRVHITQGDLVLNNKGMAKRSAELFEELNADEALRQQFIRNPTKMISERVTRKPLPPAQASAGNRFLFSLLANEDFRDWMKVFNRRVERDQPSEEERVRDFAEAVVRFGDENVMSSLAELAAAGYGIPGITNAAYTCATGTCTPTAQAQDANLSQNFTHSTSNGGRGDSWVTINPAIMRSITEHLIAHAKELALMGELSDLGIKIQ